MQTAKRAFCHEQTLKHHSYIGLSDRLSSLGGQGSTESIKMGFPQNSLIHDSLPKNVGRSHSPMRKLGLTFSSNCECGVTEKKKKKKKSTHNINQRVHKSGAK